MPLQGTAFPSSERERLGLRGLLPIKVLDMQAQVQIAGFLSCAPTNHGCGVICTVCHRSTASWTTTSSGRPSLTPSMSLTEV